MTYRDGYSLPLLRGIHLTYRDGYNSTYRDGILFNLMRWIFIRFIDMVIH